MVIHSRFPNTPRQMSILFIVIGAWSILALIMLFALIAAARRPPVEFNNEAASAIGEHLKAAQTLPKRKKINDRASRPEPDYRRRNPSKSNHAALTAR